MHCILQIEIVSGIKLLQVREQQTGSHYAHRQYSLPTIRLASQQQQVLLGLFALENSLNITNKIYRKPIVVMAVLVEPLDAVLNADAVRKAAIIGV